jgi:two-component sensor histidine kinase
VPFDSLLRTELQAYDEPERTRVALDGPAISLPSEMAVPIGMALHELATNAVKHGALRDPDGRIEVTWTIEDGKALAVTWNEHDGGPVALPTREGFGSQLLKRILTAQIGADVEIAFDPDGLRVNLSIPLRIIEEEA